MYIVEQHVLRTAAILLMMVGVAVMAAAVVVIVTIEMHNSMANKAVQQFTAF
jgi:hypothetical protein